jgi:hypothetical protein
MHILLIYHIAVTTLGFDVGWQRLPEGGMEYIIQLDPQTLDALRAGQPIESDIPAAAGEVRSYRITLGKAKLPRETPPMRPMLQEKSPLEIIVPKEPSPPTSNLGIKPHAGQPVIFEEAESKAAAGKPLPAATRASPEKSTKPWLPLTVTLLGLFGSLGANVYLGWLAWGFRQRCRTR